MGESLALAAAFGWVGSSVFLERASKETGTLAVNLIRLVIAMLFLGDFFLYKSYIKIGPRITLLVMTFSPIAVSILSFFILGEKIEGFKVLGMLLTIIGIAIVILKKKNDKEFSKVGFIYALLAMLGESLGIVFTRLGSIDYDSFATIQVRTIPAILAFIVYISLKKEWSNIKEGILNKKGMIYIVLGTIVATLGVTALVEAMKYANVGIVSTLAATSPILIIPISIIFFKEKVSILEGIGALISFVGITIFFIL